jgi:ectoine hydroxylase-related dioxygenase (phytanoyl-CoA dioxygenase family)
VKGLDIKAGELSFPSFEAALRACSGGWVTPTLSADARETYEREGWLFVRQFIDAQMVSELLRSSEKLEAQAKNIVQDTVVRGVGFEVQSASGRKGEVAVSPGALRKISFPSKGQHTFANLRRDEGVLTALTQLGLDAPKCLVDQINFKLPRHGTGFPFHQDAHFVVGATQGRLERHGGLNLVIALDSADAENGGFVVLGRTHTSGLKQFPYDRESMNEGFFDETHRTLVAMQPGDAVLFHPLLAHGSGRNESDRPRRLITMWFRGGGPALVKASSA